jgi:uncharacterized protein YejL (UPF0352 family)
VRERLFALVEEHRLGTVLALMSFGNLAADKARRSMELYAREVVPWVRERADTWFAEQFPHRVTA